MPQKATNIKWYLLHCLHSIALIAAMVVTAGAEEVAAAKPVRENPHNKKGFCRECHVASESDLNSWFTFGSTKKKLARDYNETCIKCHPARLGHGLGKVPQYDHKKLPFDAEGKVTCAITCHDMHITKGNAEQLRYYLRWPYNTLCESCHLD